LLLNAKPSNPQAQLNIDVYKDGTKPIATTEKQPDKKLTVQDVDEGDYIVRVFESWRDGEETAFELTTLFKPADPDELSEGRNTPGSARELAFDKSVEDTVDYSARKRTHMWKVAVPGPGGVQLKFENKDKDKAKINASFVDPNGKEEKIDPVAGFKKDDLPAGDYFVKVEANDAGDAGRYELRAAYKAGDLCKNGPENCSRTGALDLKLPADQKKGEVDNSKGKAFAWYKWTFPGKGKLNVTFKPEGKGSKAVAGLQKNEGDEVETFKGTISKEITEPSELYLQVAANEPGDAGKFAFQAVFQPANALTVEVAEKRGSPCMLTVGPGAGTNQGVRDGLQCTVVTPQGQLIDQCVVDRAFSNMSQVRPMGSCSKIDPRNAKVLIQIP
jgi:hypothetical protein